MKRTEDTEKGSLVKLEFSYDFPVVGAIELEGRTSCYTEAIEPPAIEELYTDDCVL